jgi:hypothetical protein
MSADDIVFLREIAHKDSEISKKIDPTLRDADKTFRILKERLDLYDQTLKLPISAISTLYLISAKSAISAEAAVATARKDFDEQTSQIISRLDNIENDIKIIKQKLGLE